jgi:hypothetical protein
MDSCVKKIDDILAYLCCDTTSNRPSGNSMQLPLLANDLQGSVNLASYDRVLANSEIPLDSLKFGNSIGMGAFGVGR